MVNCRSRFTSVLRVVFEDETLNTVRLLPLIKAQRYLHAPAVTCVYMHLHANCCFQICSISSYLCSVEYFTQIQIDLDLASPPRIRIDLDLRSRGASPNDTQRFYIHKIDKSASKSETETFGIVGRFHRFEENPTSIQQVNVCMFLYSTYRKNFHLG